MRADRNADTRWLSLGHKSNVAWGEPHFDLRYSLAFSLRALSNLNRGILFEMPKGLMEVDLSVSERYARDSKYRPRKLVEYFDSQ